MMILMFLTGADVLDNILDVFHMPEGSGTKVSSTELVRYQEFTELNTVPGNSTEIHWLWYQLLKVKTEISSSEHRAEFGTHIFQLWTQESWSQNQNRDWYDPEKEIFMWHCYEIPSMYLQFNFFHKSDFSG